VARLTALVSRRIAQPVRLGLQQFNVDVVPNPLIVIFEQIL
jgi:hypothetical protein